MLVSRWSCLVHPLDKGHALQELQIEEHGSANLTKWVMDACERTCNLEGDTSPTTTIH